LCRRPDGKMAGTGRNSALKQPPPLAAITTRLREAAIRPWKSWSAPSAFRLLCDLTKGETRVSGGSKERLHVPRSGCAGDRMGNWPGLVETRVEAAATRRAVCIPTDSGRRSTKSKAGRLAHRVAITTYWWTDTGKARGGARSATRVSPFCRPIAILLTRHGADHARDQGEGGQPAAIFLVDGDSY